MTDDLGGWGVLIAVIGGAIRLSVPYLFVSLGETLTEKGGRVNLGLEGILVMGIAVDFAEEVAAYAEQVEFNYPILVGQEDAMAVAESSGVQFIAMPFTMFISRHGEFLSAYIGELHRNHLDEDRKSVV